MSSLFGSTAPAPATSLFGNTNASSSTLPAFGQANAISNTASQLPSAGTLGASTTTGTGLFGQQQPQQATGLFGSTPSAQPAATANIFAQSSQPTSTPNIFGQTASSAQPATTTNIFGQTTTSNQPATTPSVFGQTASSTQPTTATPNIFGQPSSSQPAATSNIFGQSSASANPLLPSQSQSQGTGLGLFGNLGASQSATSAAPSAFGGFGTSTSQPGSSLFGQPQPTQLQQQPSTVTATAGNSGASPLFTRTTKFNDLPDDIKKKFEQIDAHIQGRVQISGELKLHKLGEEPQKGSEQIRTVHKKLVASTANLRADISMMRDLRTKMDQAVQDTIAATRIIDAFKSPHSPQQGIWLKTYAGFPLEFFTRVTEQLRDRLQWFNTTIEQIERKLASEVNHTSVTPQAITSTLQVQHSSFVALASKTAALDAELEKIKATYRQLWRARTGSARDPFNEVDRGVSEGVSEFGLDGLKI